MSAAKKQQTKAEREYILQNLDAGVRRIQVVTDTGAKLYKKPAEVDCATDEIILSTKGLPVVMRGKPGRKPANKTTALHAVTPQIQQVSEARDEHLDNHALVRTVKVDSQSDLALDAVIVGLAEEAASIEFERMEAHRHGKDATNISTKRARVLKATADVILKRKALAAGGLVDLDSPAFGVLFSYIMEAFKESMREVGIRQEEIEQTFTSLVSTLREDSWKEEAKSRMKDKVQ